MNLQELIKKHFGDDEAKLNTFLEDMKTNKIFTASEENLDTRYSKLKGDFEAKTKEYDESQNLIAELKKASKGNEEMQTKFTEYESKVAELQAENEQLKIENALKVELLGAKAKASDLDYLMFKYKQENNEITLDDNGKIKGFDIEKIKTAYPNNFEVESKKEVDVNNLPNINDKQSTITKEDFQKMGYQERNKLYLEDKELYTELSK